jgi:DNA end-binding protein Ku
VQSPVALYPATTETEKTRFHQINRRTGNRIRYVKVDVGTGEEVDGSDVIMGYEIAKGRYVPISGEEFDAIAPESRHVLDIDEFVPKREVDELYHLRPYYIAPDGAAGLEAFAVIRDVIAGMERVALGRIVLTNREHVIALERRGKGLLGMLLRYPYEVRKADEYFAAIPDVKLTEEVLDLAERIVRARSGHFRPEKFDDHYESALRELIRRKQKGEPIEPARRPEPTNVVSLRDALRRSAEAEGAARKVSSRRRAQTARPRNAARHGGRAKRAV